MIHRRPPSVAVYQKPEAVRPVLCHWRLVRQWFDPREEGTGGQAASGTARRFSGRRPWAAQNRGSDPLRKAPTAWYAGGTAVGVWITHDGGLPDGPLPEGPLEVA